MAVKYKTIPKPEAIDVLCFFMERGETIEEIVAAIPFYDHTGKRAEAAYVRGWYEEFKRLRVAEDKSQPVILLIALLRPASVGLFFPDYPRVSAISPRKADIAAWIDGGGAEWRVTRCSSRRG